MFDELTKYTRTNHFFFSPTDNLREVCNAPQDCCGVYLVYALKNGSIELVYIGRSGKLGPDGSLIVRKAGLGGLKDRLVNGKQFGDPRHKSWKGIMLIEGIEALDVYWYVTHQDGITDSPEILEKKLLSKYKDMYGKLPKWNRV